MAVSVVPWAVIMMMGSLGFASRSWAATSMPLSPGSFRSVRTRSKGCRLGLGQSFVSSLHQVHSVAFGLQNLLQGGDRARVIFYQQYSWLASVSFSGQHDFERGAAVYFGPVTQKPTMLFNDPGRDGQP